MGESLDWVTFDWIRQLEFDVIAYWVRNPDYANPASPHTLSNARAVALAAS
jgi:hypothetical protein